MIVFAVNQLVGKKIPSRYWRTWLDAISRATTGRQRGELSIAIVSAPAMQRLNRQYRGKNRPTDVLSFAERDSRSKTPATRGAVPLGEVIICYPQAVRQATAAGVPLSHELQRLFTHGVLHLLGYDHGTDRDAAKMEALERQLLRD